MQKKTRRRPNKLSEQVEKVSSSPVGKTPSTKAFFPTGATLLNLACSDTPDAGYGAGTMVNLIGDSSSGKTFLALTMLADMANDPKFKDYKLIYDDAEAGSQFDVAGLFGKKTAERIITDGISNTITDFQNNVFREVKGEKPFVYVLDSFDGLTTDEELEKAELKLSGKKVTGTFGMHKAKGAHQLMRMIVSQLKDTKSLLLIISQIKDDISISFATKTRTGGHALDFYASHILWTVKTKNHKKKERIIGINSKAKVSKNRITGKVREANYPIYYSYGVDNLGSMIDFLLDEGILEKKGQKISAPFLAEPYSRTKLIELVESDSALEKELICLVRDIWNKIEDDLKLDRKPKYE